MSSRRSRRASSRIATSDSFGGSDGAGSALSRAGRIVGAVGFTASSSARRRSALRLQLRDQLKLLGQAAEVAATARRDDDEVLDPYAELARQVDARLDRHHLALLQTVLPAR